MILETILDVLKTISKDESRISIKVNPVQLALTKQSIPEIMSSVGLESKINIYADDIIEIGSCIVQTSNGVVDATINTQLEIIKEAFKGI